MELEKQNGNKGLVIAELINRTSHKTKNDETFYILEISTCRTITKTVLELRNENNSVSINGKETLFVFTSRGKGNKYAYTLEKGCIYAFWFTKSYNSETQEDYFHVTDWRKLSVDKRSIERTLRLVLNKEEENGEEEIITNRELLTELKERIRNKKISFKLSATDNGTNILDIDTDLKDNESNFRINLQNDEND